jgi:hypothetical protein
MGKLNKQYLAEMARKGWITVSVAAKLCRRHRATVYYWINKGYVARCEVNAGKRRTLFVDYLRAIQDTLDAGYFTAWSRSAAECAQRAVFRETAKDSR